MVFSQTLSPADAAIMETFVVPRYLSLFGDLALEMLLVGEGARVVHLGCRTGYPDLKILDRTHGAALVGLDSSQPALDLARNKAAALGDVPITYSLAEHLPVEVDGDVFSHAICLHPQVSTTERLPVFQEMHRLLYAGGQALIALPLRGSFLEITDLFKEYALKNDDADLSEAIENAFQTRPSIETLSDELESIGFEDVDVEIRHTEISFDSGRALVEDPLCRLLVLPEVRSWLGVNDLAASTAYLRDAVDKYWSEDKFELTVNVGCASARKPTR